MAKFVGVAVADLTGEIFVELVVAVCQQIHNLNTIIKRPHSLPLTVNALGIEAKMGRCVRLVMIDLLITQLPLLIVLHSHHPQQGGMIWLGYSWYWWHLYSLHDNQLSLWWYVIYPVDGEDYVRIPYYTRGICLHQSDRQYISFFVGQYDDAEEGLSF